jgi:hypothetical protein
LDGVEWVCISDVKIIKWFLKHEMGSLVLTRLKGKKLMSDFALIYFDEWWIKYLETMKKKNRKNLVNEICVMVFGYFSVKMIIYYKFI